MYTRNEHEHVVKPRDNETLPGLILCLNRAQRQPVIPGPLDRAGLLIRHLSFPPVIFVAAGGKRALQAEGVRSHSFLARLLEFFP